MRRLRCCSTIPLQRPESELEALWRGDPRDWDPWLVHADRLTVEGDERGELLLVEQELRDDPDVGLFLKQWLDRDLLHLLDAESLEWAVDLKRKIEPLLGGAPDRLREALSRPISQVLALAPLNPDGTWDEHRPRTCWVQHHHDSLIAGLVRWIERAFDGVPCPEAPHRTLRQAEAADSYDTCDRSGDPVGRWQDLPDAYLLQCQWALSHLDAHGLHHYLPAILCFDLRHRTDLHPEDSWLTESLEYHLEPSRGELAEYQRRRFTPFTPSQRRAIAAFECSYYDGAARGPWLRAVLEPRRDWIAEFQRG